MGSKWLVIQDGEFNDSGSVKVIAVCATEEEAGDIVDKNRFPAGLDMMGCIPSYLVVEFPEALWGKDLSE